MSKFKKEGKKSAPGVNTSSLPDIVFMLLFFFMVATTTKESDPTVEIKPPSGIRTTDLTPYKQRSEIDFAYLGRPRNPARRQVLESEGITHMLFLDNVEQPNPDQLYSTNAIRKWKKDKYEAKKSRVKKDISEVITCVKADQTAPMGIIFDMRSELQEINALSIAYAVKDNSSM